MIANFAHRVVLGFVGWAVVLETMAVPVGFTFLSVSKAAVFLLVALTGFEMAVARRRMPGGMKSVFFITFCISVFVSGVYSIAQGLAGAQLKHYSEIYTTWPSLLIFYIVMSFVVFRPSDLRTVIFGQILGMLTVLVTGMLGLGQQGEVYEGARVGGFGGNPNSVALHYTFVLPMVAGMLVTAKSAMARMAYTGILVAFIFGLAITLSRAGYVGLALMALFWMVRFQRFDTLRYVVFALPLLPLLYFIMPDAVFVRLGSLSPDSIQADGSAMSRVGQAQMALKAFLLNPIIGIGTEQFVPWSHAQGTPIEHTIHNVPLLLATEQGLLGFIPFVGIVIISWNTLGLAYRWARRYQEHESRELYDFGMLCAYLQIGLAGAMACSMFHPALRDKQLWMFLGLCTGIGTILRSLVTQHLRAKGALVEDPPAPLAAPVRPAAAAASDADPVPT